MLRLIFFNIVCFLFLPLISCTNDQVVEMEAFERNLIHTWIALEREDEALTNKFAEATRQNWTLLNTQYQDIPLHLALRQSKNRVNIWMLNLHNAVANGQPDRAKIAVNLIQNELRVLRPKFGLNHPADRLYDFSYHWQDLVLASNDPMMCLLEWNEFEERYEAASKSWQEYLAARPAYSDTLFPGYGGNAADSETTGIAISRGLEEFENIFSSADHTLAAAPSRVINDLFFDYLAIITAYPSESDAAAVNQ